LRRITLEILSKYVSGDSQPTISSLRAMLERLLSSVGATHIDRTLLIASAYASHKDPLPGLAITTLARYDAGDQQALWPCVGALTGILDKRAGKRFRLEQNTSALALLWWLSSVCPDCSGLGHLKLPDTPTLEDAACPTCNGSKLRPHASDLPGYAHCLLLLDGAYDWARRVAYCMPMAYDVRVTAEVA